MTENKFNNSQYSRVQFRLSGNLEGMQSLNSSGMSQK